MTYHLSPAVITDTIHALAAVQSLSLPDDQRSALSPLLDTDRQGIKAHLVRNAFASIAMELGPLVLDISLDGETADNSSGPIDPTDAPASLLSITLLVPDGFTATRHGLVRRALEQAIAMRALADWCLALPDHSSVAASFLSLASQSLASLREALTPILRPCIRP